MKILRRVPTYLAALPNDLVAWFAVLLIWLLWGTNLRWEEEALVCELKSLSWPARSWYRIKRNGKYEMLPDGSWRTWAGTTFGHAIMYGPGRLLGGARDHWVEIQRHEHVHVEQAEVAMLVSLLFAVVVLIAGAHWGVALVVWACGYLAMGVCGWVTAWLRGEDSYRGSTHEESAYCQEKGEEK